MLSRPSSHADLARREVLRSLAQSVISTAVIGSVPALAFAREAASSIEVWRTSGCLCCGKWISHLQDNGFTVQARVVADVAPIRHALGVPATLRSCHTARVGGYVIEGHVPAPDILQLLRERPGALGLSVPEMPLGSPGMESPAAKAAYDVLLVAKGGDTRVFKSYR